MITHVSTILNTGSQELTDYLEKYAVGNTITSPDGQQIWTVMEHDINANIPPNPHTGAFSTRVALVVEDHLPSTRPDPGVPEMIPGAPGVDVVRPKARKP
jgi:hypothetical protein